MGSAQLHVRTGNSRRLRHGVPHVKPALALSRARGIMLYTANVYTKMNGFDPIDASDGVPGSLSLLRKCFAGQVCPGPLLCKKSIAHRWRSPVFLVASGLNVILLFVVALTWARAQGIDSVRVASGGRQPPGRSGSVPSQGTLRGPPTCTVGVRLRQRPPSWISAPRQ